MFLLTTLAFPQVTAEEEVHCTGINGFQGELYTSGFPKYRTIVWYRLVFEYDCNDGMAHTVGAQTESDCETGFWYSNIDILSCTNPSTQPATDCVQLAVRGEFQYASGNPHHHWLRLDVHGCNDGSWGCSYADGGDPVGDIETTCKLIET